MPDTSHKETVIRTRGIVMSDQLTPLQDAAASQAEDEILVAVRAVAPEFDEMIKAEPLPEGWLAGWDVAGVVMRAAPEGFSPKPGDRVVGVATGTAWSSCMALPTEYATVLPDHVSFEQAAALRVAVLTALRLVRGAGQVRGRRVLVTGAGVGIGRLLVELLAALGGEVTAVVAGDGQAAAAAGLGAAVVVTDPADVTGAFDVVYEAAEDASAAELRRPQRGHRLLPLLRRSRAGGPEALRLPHGDSGGPGAGPAAGSDDHRRAVARRARPGADGRGLTPQAVTA